MQVKLDNATFDVSFHDDDDWEDHTGMCDWTVSKKQLADVYAATNFKDDNFEPQDLTFDPEHDDDDEMAEMADADSLLIFLAAASTLPPTTYKIDYTGQAYWFFHDMIHAKYDSGDGSDVYIDENSEMRALPMGAKLAAEHGVPISDIIKELSKAGKEFEGRFGFDFDPVKAFFDSVEVVLK